MTRANFHDFCTAFYWQTKADEFGEDNEIVWRLCRSLAITAIDKVPKDQVLLAKTAWIWSYQFGPQMQA